MNHLIVYAHPKEDSFNHAILESATRALESKGHSVVVRDLYALAFTPVLTQADFKALHSGNTPHDILTEQAYITHADVITLIYPLWWTSMPAILKGYIDRVFSYGFAYQYTKEGTVEGLFSAKKTFMITTQGTPNAFYDASGMTKSLIQTTDEGIFGFCEATTLGHLFFGGISASDDVARKAMLQTVESKLKELF
jgi:NAD(P)H dehydrogenase (quinone)